MLRWALLPLPVALAASMPFACATGDRNFEESSESTSGPGGQGSGAGASSSSTGGAGGVGGSSSVSSTAAGMGGGHVLPDAGEDAPVEAPDLVDLVADAITRDVNYYFVEFCNVGTAGSVAKFTVQIENTGSGQAFESNPLYPFDVPAPGTCAMTGGYTCGLIGDPGCNLSITVKATVDLQNTVAEANEGNNTFSVAF